MKSIAVIVLFFCVFAVRAQQINTGYGIEDIIEQIASSHLGQPDYNQLVQNLYFYYNNPLNLNIANRKSLEKFIFLNDFQIKSILYYARHSGPIVSVYELQLVEGMDNKTINELLPFVTVEPVAKADTLNILESIKYGRHTFYARTSSILEKQSGFITDSTGIAPFQGNSLRLYSRYAFHYKDKIYWGVTMEKDPGESFFAQKNQKGFDFYSFHLEMHNKGILKTVVAGDYQTQFGQGLIMWSNIAYGKTSAVLDIRKRGQGLRRYSSTDENAFFRGIGATFSFKDVDFTLFGSYKSRDANIINDTLEQVYFTSLQTSGIHSLKSEIHDKNSVGETVTGGNATLKGHYFNVGVSAIYYSFNTPFIPALVPENVFRFRGRQNSCYSVNAEYRFNKIHIFGETALSQNGGKAIVAGALMEFTPLFYTSVLYRNYGKDFQSLYGNAFSEGSSTQNEKGFYTSCELIPSGKWKISAYYDIFSFPWIKRSVSAPSRGDDYLLQANYTLSQNVNMYWRIKREQKQKDANTEQQGIPKLMEYEKVQLRYQLNYAVSTQWYFRNRIELSRFTTVNNTDKGYLVYQDIIYKSQQKPFSIVFRYTLFDTDSYYSRIYTYENNLLYTYSVPAFSGSGTRAYIMLKYSVDKNIDLWLRLSQTNYSDRDIIGDGYNTIDGNRKSDIRFQVRVRI